MEPQNGSYQKGAERWNVGGYKWTVWEQKKLENVKSYAQMTEEFCMQVFA